MESVKARNLSKIYGTNENPIYAINHMDFSIQKGELLAITGPSGSGKSTLLHMLGGIDTPSDGEVLIDGENVFAMKDKERTLFRRKNIGLIYQFFNLIPVLNVEENMLLPMRLEDKKSQLPEGLLTSLGLEERSTHLPSQLSGGQQQRVAIGRALVMKPSLILADEPTGNLDQQNSREIMKLLRDCNQAYQQTIVIVTHDKDIANACDRVISLQDGKLN